MSEDPAVLEAKRLWGERRAADAMNVLVKRIHELNASRTDSLPSSDAVTLLHHALSTFTKHGWRVLQRTEHSIQFSKRPGVNLFSGLIVSFALSWLGFLVVLLQSRLSEIETVTLNREANGVVTMTTGHGYGVVGEPEIDKVARSVKDGVSIGLAFFLSMCSSIVYAMLIM